MKTDTSRVAGIVTVYLRLALGFGFLSAVADRFGWWGAPGTNGIAWGNFENFLAYTATLNPFLPTSAIPVVGWIATIAEIVFGLLLILGFRLRSTAFTSGVLLLLFAIGMVIGAGIKAPLDYSVLAASAGAFQLAMIGSSPWSIDAWRGKKYPSAS